MATTAAAAATTTTTTSDQPPAAAATTTMAAHILPSARPSTMRRIWGVAECSSHANDTLF